MNLRNDRIVQMIRLDNDYLLTLSDSGKFYYFHVGWTREENGDIIPHLSKPTEAFIIEDEFEK